MSDEPKPVPPARDDVTSSETDTEGGSEKPIAEKAESSEKSSTREKKSKKKGSAPKGSSKKRRSTPAPAPPPEAESAEVPEDLVCPVCKEQLSDPRLLPCLHAVCSKCLTKCGRGETVTCPVCSLQADAGKSFSRIPPDYYRGSMVEGFVQTETGPKCQPCADEDEEEDAVNWCTECNVGLCDLHTQLHGRLKATKDHKVVPYDKADADTSVSNLRRKTVRCKKHPSQDLSLWCTKCRQVICRDCGLEDHNEHLKKPAKEYAKDVSHALKDARSKTASRIPEVEKSIREVEHSLSTVARKKEATSKDIEAFIGRMHALIDSRKDSLLSEAEGAANEKTGILEKQQATLQRLLMSLQTSTSYVAEVLKEGSEVEILLEKDSLGSCMSNLGATNWERHPLDNGQIEFVVGKEEKNLDAQIWKTAGVHDGKNLRRGIKGASPATAKASSGSTSTPRTPKAVSAPAKKISAKEQKALEKKAKEQQKASKKGKKGKKK